MKIKNNFFFTSLLLAVACVAAYSNSWHVPFQFDDEANILKWWMMDISKIHHIWEFNVKTRFLPYLSFALNYFFCRENVVGYHIFNVGIHIANGIWVYLLTALLLKTPKMKGLFSEQACNAIALLSGLIFVLHPLQTQSVTYIVQRITLFVSFFYLGACVLYLQYRLKGRFQLYLGAWVMSVAAMFCKETAVTLPFTIIIMDGVFFGFLNHSKTKVARDWIPFLLTVAIIPYLFYFLPKARWGDSFLALQMKALPWQQYFLTQFHVVATYLRLFFLPVGQNLDYDFPVIKTLRSPWALFFLSVLLSVAATAVLLFRRNKILAFSIIWLFVTLSVESSFFPIDDVIFEHRMYLPLAGCAMFTAVALFSLIKKLNIYRYCIVGAVIILCILTFSRNAVWGSRVSLWQDVVKKSPQKARGYYNLGLAFDMQNETEKAISFYKRSLDVDPGYYLALINLGVLEGRDGNYPEAVRLFTRAAHFAPLHAPVFDNLAVAYWGMRDIKNALANFKKAVQIDPYYPEVYEHVGVIMMDNGHPEEAVGYFQKAVSVNPYYAEAIFQLGKTLVTLKKPDAAQPWLRRLKVLNRDDLALELQQLINHPK